jgi:hypothetical protein
VHAELIREAGRRFAIVNPQTTAEDLAGLINSLQ